MKKICTLFVAASIAISSVSSFAGQSDLVKKLDSKQAIRTELMTKLSTASQAELREFVATEYGPKALKRIEAAVANGEDINRVAAEIVSGSEYTSRFCYLVGGQVGGWMFGIGAVVAIASGLKMQKSESEVNAKAENNRVADSLVAEINTEIIQLKAEGVREDSYLITSRVGEITQINIQRNAENANLDREISDNKSKGQTYIALGAVAGAIALPALMCRY